jgi:hypothetical protein
VVSVTLSFLATRLRTMLRGEGRWAVQGV